MSNMKRQSSWQEDIARNFSRLFQISKSQDPEKTEESDISGQQNGVCSSLHSETSEGEPSLHQEDLELSKAFQGTEEEGDVREGVLGEALEDRESQGKDKGGEGSSSISDDAGGALVPPLSVDSVPCSPASPPGPGSPTRPPPLDAFFRRLGSLFHFKAEPATAVQQQEEQQQAEEGGEGQEEEETALAVVSIEPDLSGMTCGAEGDQDHCDSAGSLPGEKDTRHTETEDRREGESDLHSISTSTRNPTHTDLETLEKPPCLAPGLYLTPCPCQCQPGGMSSVSNTPGHSKLGSVEVEADYFRRFRLSEDRLCWT